MQILFKMGNLVMATITMAAIMESNLIKKEACNNCKDALKSKLTTVQLKQFEDDFYDCTDGYLFKRKEN